MAFITQDLLDILEEIAPFDLTESWDNTGLLVGSPQRPVQGVLLGLDPTQTLIDQALAVGADVIITHHPVIFHPLQRLETDQPSGAFLAAALRHDVQVIACHTNLDAAPGGVNDTLAKALDLEATSPLVLSGKEATDSGLGRIGRCRRPLTPEECVTRLRQILGPPYLLEAGPRPERISTIALCGGSGSDLAVLAHRQGADLYLTAEIKHATACWAVDQGLWLIDGGHFATEQPAMAPLRDRIEEALHRQRAEISVHLAEQKPPLTMIP